MDMTMRKDADYAGRETKGGVHGPEARVLELGGFYSRDQIITVIMELCEDCSALSDAQLAQYASKKLKVRVICLDGFVGLVFHVMEKGRTH
jgi:hypothetical protein